MTALDDQINNAINNAINSNSGINQFSSASTPFHVHNGTDTPSVDYQNLINRDHVINVVVGGTLAATSADYGVFFTAAWPCIFVGATEVHSTAGSLTPTLQVEKLVGTTATGSGINLLSVPFNLAATANTVQTASRAKIINANFNLAKGDRMGLSLSGTPTTLANVVVMILLKY
jgi:hypothetical protein